MMEGRSTNVSTIYGASTAVTGNPREDLADNINRNAVAERTRKTPVVREQYCMCTPKTRLEKRLVITVVSLVVFIILLVIIVVILATQEGGGRSLQRVMSALTPNF